MSTENAHQFLRDVSLHNHLRDEFKETTTPEQFIQKCQDLGYDFTTDELKEVIASHSEGVEIRRKTGIWVWLRQVNWI